MDNVKNKIISFRLTTEEYNKLKTYSANEDMKVSAYVRKLLQNIQDNSKSSLPPALAPNT